MRYKGFLLLLCMTLWWVFWLSLSFFELTAIRKPSAEAYLYFFLLVSSFILGGGFSLILNGKKYIASPTMALKSQDVCKPRSSIFISILLLSFLCLQLYCLYRAGFFDMSYSDYNFYLRRGELEGYLTGIKSLDLFLKILLYPSLVALLVSAFSGAVSKNAFFLVLCNFLVFSVLWQVNYPVLMLLWILVVYLLFSSQVKLHVNIKYIFYGVSICAFLVYAASLRYGGLAWKMLEHYFVNYHLVGFSFFDAKLSDPDSVLHKLSFGRSSLGFLDQFFDLALRFFGADYIAASFQNTNDNMEQVDIGLYQAFYTNAFGTMAFSFYRDFWLFGVVLLPFIYGFYLIGFYLKSSFSWRARAVFLLLAYGWLTGMMVSPVEQSYFWFSIVTIVIFTKLSVRRLFNKMPEEL